MPTTAAIFGLRAVQKAWPEDYADWAAGMLESGYDSRSLRILAGLTKADSRFEAEEYFTKALSELGMDEPPRENALRDYAIYLAELLLEGKISVRHGVRRLSHLCAEANYPDWLMAWLELDDAIDSVFPGNEPPAYPGLAQEDLKDIVLAEAKRFINDNQPPNSPASRLTE